MPVVLSQPEPVSVSPWPSFLSGKIARLLINQSCPENQIIDINISKDKDNIRGDIATINWDIDCPKNSIETSAPPQKNTEQSNESFSELILQLRSLPNTDIRIHELTLTQEQLKQPVSFSIAMQKRQQKLHINVKGELFSGILTLNFLDNSLNFESDISLHKITRFIALPESLQSLLSSQFKLAYTSQIESWQQGDILLLATGAIKRLTEKVQTEIKATLDLQKKTLLISQLDAKLSKVSYQISPSQRWETSYIQSSLVQPAELDLTALTVSNLHSQLRVGRSQILTEVKRGKSKRIRIDKQKLPPIFLALEGQASAAQFALDFRLAVLNQSLNGEIRYQNNIVNLVLSEQTLSAPTLATALQDYLANLELLEVQSGEIKAQLLAQYDLNHDHVKIKSQLKAKSIAGQYENILFDGVNVSSDLDYLIDREQFAILHDKQQLSIDNLFVGIPIQALELNARMNASEVVIDHFKMRLLGGRIDFDDLALNAPSQTVLNIAGLELSEIIKHSAYPDIDSKGVIDGMLPLALTDKGIMIDNGLVFARPPGGYIKVPANTVVKAMGNGNPAFTLTMQILTNFQFDTLQGVIGYTDDGESEFDLKLKGINPEVTGVQPINFNYTHQENILKLLKSLRFNEQLIRQIKERH